MKTTRKILYAFAALAILAGCGKEKLPGGGQEQQEQQEQEEQGSSLTVSGVVKDTQGKPFAGTIITDGKTVVVTGADGKYKFERDRYARFIQCTIPADAKIECSGEYNLPSGHYKKISSGKKVYDFIYERQPVETEFRLLGLGDPQVRNEDQVTRFRTQTLGDIRGTVVAGSRIPTYAITLGDAVSNQWELFPSIAAAYGECVIPIFSTIGNHDHKYIHDATDRTDAQAREEYENVFGPSTYSFDRGECHIVSMDDVDHLATASNEYGSGFEKWQYEWLRKDLSFVDKNKRIILCVHIPMKNSFGPMHSEVGYNKEVIELLGGFKDAVVISGHTHNIQTHWTKTTSTGKKIREYVVGATCGAWWHGTICVNGEPDGYDVFEFNGTELVNEYYKATLYPEDFQMRMFRSTDDVCQPFTITDGKEFKLPKYGDGIIYFHAFNQRDWTFTVYEDGVASKATVTKMTIYDQWGKRVFSDMGLIDSSNYQGTTQNMFQVTLKNPAAKEVRVEAVDEYGHRYSVDTFTTSSMPGRSYDYR